MTAHLVPPLQASDLERAAERDAAEQVIAVDAQDQPLGVAGKLAAHQDGQLHRAFSILVFNTQGELLLQRRAASKYHFANYWSNTCCGHPRPDETTPAAAGRRLKEEFGIRVPLSERAEFVYRAEDQASGLIEHEYLHVFYGVHAEAPRPDPTEIGAWRWMSVAAIRRALRQHPDWFTPWFKLLVERILTT
ncbi:isopentenyl-diphosphate delta-isomerase [Allochromatium warmingii]|uniref:Isopentenyl-diphosphate Delta-isomerase n=1 Tax=Allochromatium warmingii TaxID=61595 RepID=A0A1H3FLL6_ALLWA|nr:isopentenyl-diphosphate Delta-isomerase [Allochromatium warmingii]SDX91735.1 isopentenyl-diphosphate delta-isomerase [Allochromatium warmingii]